MSDPKGVIGHMFGIPIVINESLEGTSEVGPTAGRPSLPQDVYHEAPSLSEVDPGQGTWMQCPNCLTPGHFDEQLDSYLTLVFGEKSDFIDPIWWNPYEGTGRYECIRCWDKPSANFNL
jgi:hypothetical protein